MKQAVVRPDITKPGVVIPVQSDIQITTLMGVAVLRIVKDPSVEAIDEPTYGKVIDSPFKNGTIKVKVLPQSRYPIFFLSGLQVHAYTKRNAGKI